MAAGHISELLIWGTAPHVQKENPQIVHQLKHSKVECSTLLVAEPCRCPLQLLRSLSSLPSWQSAFLATSCTAVMTAASRLGGRTALGRLLSQGLGYSCPGFGTGQTTILTPWARQAALLSQASDSAPNSFALSTLHGPQGKILFTLPDFHFPVPC